MGVLSKFFGGTLGFSLLTASCHEFGHTWNPNCYFALTDALGDALFFCFKTYGLLYLINSALRSGGNPKKMNWRHILKNTLRSSIFLTTNLVLLIFFICRMRQFLGFTIWPTASFVSSFSASLISIFIEAKKRRLMLALYLSNLASESVFRQLLNRGKVRELPGAQTLLFSVGLAVIFQLLGSDSQRARTANQKHKLSAIKSFTKNCRKSSNEDETSLSRKSEKREDNDYLHDLINLTHCDMRISVDARRTKAAKFITHFLKLLPTGWRQYFVTNSTFDRLKSNLNFLSNGAARFILAIQHSTRNFLATMCVNLLLNFFKNARQPAKFFKSLQHPGSLLRMPLFFALMPLLYQLADSIIQAIPLKFVRSFSSGICGGVSGLAMLAWPNTNISMYVLWKSIEMLYNRLIKLFPFVPSCGYGDAILYSIASGYVVGLAVIEPHTLRGNYYKFLTGLTGNRIHLFNRELIGRHFGFDSNQMYANAIPPFDARQAIINPQLYGGKALFLS